ncbi:AI-2E family transporter [Staphylococcus chromogenes]|nr:AI-2E family transporter [Staphylococcus chromogenes]
MTGQPQDFSQNSRSSFAEPPKLPDDEHLAKTRLPEEASRTFEELEGADRIDRSFIIAEGAKELASWSLRLLLISAAGYMVWWVGKQVWQGLLPIAIALIISSVLWTPTRWLRNAGLPKSLAALVSILGTVGVFGGVMAAIAPSIGRQSQTLYLQTFELMQRTQLWLLGPPFHLEYDELNGLFSEAVNWLQAQSGRIAEGLFAGLGAASVAAVTFGVVMVLTFFFLKDGDSFLPWLRTVTGRRAGWHLTELLTRVWITLSGYIRAQALVSMVDAVVIGGGLVLIGVPMALALATLTFFAGFIPIVGAVVAGALAVLIALVSLGVTKALLVLALVVAVQQLEGNILSPLLQSRAMNLHPVIVLFSVTVGGSLFGIMGAFLAVPVAATIAVFFRYLNDIIALRSGEKTADEISFATDAGSITGVWSEEIGRKLRDARFPRILPTKHNEDTTAAEAPSGDAEPMGLKNNDIVGELVGRASETGKKLAQMFPKPPRK